MSRKFPTSAAPIAPGTLTRRASCTEMATDKAEAKKPHLTVISRDHVPNHSCTNCPWNEEQPLSEVQIHDWQGRRRHSGIGSVEHSQAHTVTDNFSNICIDADGTRWRSV